jgi:hypothetical protein
MKNWRGSIMATAKLVKSNGVQGMRNQRSYPDVSILKMVSNWVS